MQRNERTRILVKPEARAANSFDSVGLNDESRWLRRKGHALCASYLVQCVGCERLAIAEAANQCNEMKGLESL